MSDAPQPSELAVEVREPAQKYLTRTRASYKRTELGSIPNDWHVKSLADFEPYVTSGSRGWDRHYGENGAPFVRITNLSRTSIYVDTSDLRFFDIAENDAEAARTALKDGDVLISITADIGIVGHVTSKVEKPAHSTHRAGSLPR